MSDLHWESRIVHLVEYPTYPDGYYLCSVTFRQDGSIFSWTDPMPMSSATRPGLAGMLSYAQNAFNHPTLVPDIDSPSGLREEKA
jgi:hypothetical protein